MHAQSSRLVELSQPGDNTLPRTSLGAIGLDQRPIGVSLAVLSSIALSNEHRSDANGANSTAKTNGRRYITGWNSNGSKSPNRHRAKTTYGKNQRSEFSKFRILTRCWGSWAKPFRLHRLSGRFVVAAI
jgi:hypothetical protein